MSGSSIIAKISMSLKLRTTLILVTARLNKNLGCRQHYRSLRCISLKGATDPFE